MHKKTRASYITALVVTLTVGLVPLLTIVPIHANAVNQYFIYWKFNPVGIGDVVAAGGYVEDYGVLGTWGDEIQYVYFLSGNTGYKVRVWLTNGGGPTDSTPSYIEPRQHPDHYTPQLVGPIEPRHFQIVSSADLTGYTGGSSSHTEEFYVDSSDVYLGAYPYGIHKWDHNWNYIGKVANTPPVRTETMAYNPAENVWYAGGRHRTIYQLNDTDNDCSLLDESWVSIFTYPTYGGSHHDGMEYVGGYLWISDMTSDVIGKWKYNTTTSVWDELKRFTYSEPGDVEGMGFGPNDHFWCGSGWGSGSYIYELGNEITHGYPLADAGPDVESYPPTINVTLDGSGSHHTDPTKEIVRYEWDFESDGIWDYNGTDPVVEHAYPAYYNPDSSINWTATAKNYTAALRVTDNSIVPMIDLDTCIVHIAAPPWKPIADPDGPYNTRICHPIQLNGNESYDPESRMFPSGHPWYENISKYEWDLDSDGQFDDSTDPCPIWHWSVEGTYLVCLKVTDSQPSGPGGIFGPLDTDTKCTVVLVGAIHDVAVANVTPSTDDAVVGEIVAIEVVVSNLGDFTETFNVSVCYDSAEIGETTVSDLPPGENQTINFDWNTTGVPICQYYTIKASADIVPGEINIGNNVMESDVKVHIKLTIPPVASFTVNPISPQVCETVTFNASSSYDPDGTIVKYEWDWEGDAIYDFDAGDNPIATHHYSTYGFCHPKLRVTDDNGETNETQTTILIREHPVANFVYSPLDPGTGETITFDATTSAPHGGEIINYRWNFGDSNITDTPNPIITHVYSTHGTYNVTLTVLDSEDKNDTTWQLITVTTHDIAVVNVTPESDWLYHGKFCRANINVTVCNQGDVPENFNVTLYYNITAGHIIGTQTVTGLPAGNCTTLTFLWNTTEVAICHSYNITAYATPVPHETDTADNTKTSSIKVKVRLLADVNDDGKVDMRDIGIAARAFGEWPGRPRWLPWGPYADINNDYFINLRDIATIAQNFGKTCP